jgi:hypothetical protein
MTTLLEPLGAGPTQAPWEKLKYHEFMLNRQEFEMAEKQTKKVS